MRATLLALVLIGSSAVSAQDPSLEYRVKAAYLFNFAKFVDWAPATGPLTICVAGRNVFGEALTDTVRGETINGRPLVVRVLLEPEPGCQIVFVPRGGAAASYLRGAGTAPALTVGEQADFIEMGGIVNFVVEGTNVRFEIDADAAQRAGLRISSRLLRLARVPGGA